MKTFTEYCKDYIKDHLNDFEGQTVTTSDLAYYITQGPNTDGTLTYSTEEAKNYLREWWDECAEYYQFEEFNYGNHPHNPFDKPEAYMLCMVIEGINLLLQDCDIFKKHWEGDIELTKRNINKIINQVNDLNDIEF